MYIVPVVDHWSVRTRPWTVYILITLNVLVYVVALLTSTVEDAQLNLGLVLREFSPIRLFTSWFVHTGFWHLAWNMFFLFMFGAPVEQVLGHARTLLLYCIAGTLGSLVYCFTPFGSQLLQVGASGAICGLVGAFGVLLRHQYVSLQGWFFVIRVWEKEVSALTTVILFLVAQLVFGAFTSMLGVVGGTGYAAHIVGIVTGMSFGLLRSARQRSDDKRSNRPKSIKCKSCGGEAPLKVDGMYRCTKCSRWSTESGAAVRG